MQRLSGEIIDAGNEYGELVKAERGIRISAGITRDSEETERGNNNERLNIHATLANFTDNCRFGSDKQISQKDRDFEYYSRLSLSIMSLPVYRQMDDSEFVTRNGRDVAQRPVIAIDASKMPDGLNHAHAMAYILRMMQPVIQTPFVMVLLNMGTWDRYTASSMYRSCILHRIDYMYNTNTVVPGAREQTSA